MAKSGYAPMVDERQFVPTTIAEARRLRARLIASGTGRSQAASIVMWLMTLDDNDGPLTDSEIVQRTRFRHRLLALTRFEDKGAYIDLRGIRLGRRAGGRARNRPFPNRPLGQIVA